MSEENNIDQQSKEPFMGRLLRFLAVMLLILFLLSILLTLVIRDSDFQNWAVKKVTTSLSEQLDTKVELERVELDFFNSLAFTNFYVEDYNKDTLIFAQELEVDLDVSLRSLLNGRLSIEEISLVNGNIKIRRDSGQFDNNLKLFANKLKENSADQFRAKEQDPSKETDTKRRPFDLNLDRINLKDICFQQNDKLRGQDLDACIESAKINFDDFILEDNLFNIDKLEVDGVNVDIFEYLRNEELFNDWYYLEVETTLPDSTIKPYVFTVKDLIVKNGSVNLKNIRKSILRTMSTKVLDYKNLDLSDIQLHFKNLNYSQNQGSGQLASMSVKEKSGFQIDDLYIDDLLVTDRNLVLKDYKMETPYSTFGSNLTLKYREYDDFWEFEDKIYINSSFQNTNIGVKDIIYMVGVLESNEFMQLNKGENLSITGNINGKINSLKGSKLQVKLGDKITFNGGFSTKNLSVKNEEFLNLNIDQVAVSMVSLRQLIPNFALPPNFDKLGNLNFSGNFTGFFNEFTAYGDLRTDLGGVTSDVSLALTQGVDKAVYDGKLNLKDFDLATWTGDDKFGNVTISAIVKEGVGLRRDVASANLSATVESFLFKGYDYQNVKIVGRLDKNKFDGDLSIADENIDLDFGGKVSFEGDKPLFNFKSNVRNIDFQKLNLSNKNLVLSGNADIDAIGDNISNITGEIYLSDFKISLNDDLNYNLDTIALRSTVKDDGIKNFHLESELLYLDLNGQFDLDKIAFAFKDFLVERFPAYAERLQIEPSGKLYDDMQFNMDLEVFDSENLTYFLDKRIDTIRDMTATGYFNTFTDSLYLLTDLPSFTYDNNKFENINLILEANNDDTEVVLGILETQLKGGQKIPAYSLFANATDDEIDFNFNINDASNEQYNMLMNGTLKVKDDKVFELSFLPSNLTLLKQEWEISEGNYIRFGKDFIEIKDFAFTNGRQNVHVDDYGTKGLKASLENFDLEEINKYTNYEKLFFDGDFTLDITAEDVFTQKNIELSLNMDTLKIFEDDWGVLSLQAKLPSLNDDVQAYLSLTKGEQQILAEGSYTLPNESIERKANSGSNFFDFDISSNAVPLSLLEYFVPTGLSGTTGFVDADVNLKGFPGDIDSDGTLRVYEGAFNVDYLKTRYFIDDGVVTLSKNWLDGTGGIVKDKFGNKAVLDGGIYHTNLKDMILDLTINAPRFLALDTKKGDNELFYGVGMGQGTVKFAGPFNQTDIDINAVTLEGTNISIPIESSANSSELGFINFVNREEEAKQEEIVLEEQLSGVNIAINLEITEATEARIIFDEDANDIVTGRGRGNIEITNKRTGEFSMFGTYEIVEGDYLFTYSYRDLVKFNKPFLVKRGGTIVWDGDPYTAQINIEAEYFGLRTSIYNLIAEFLVPPVSDTIAAEARNTTTVDLTMKLKGDLFAPDISFKLDFPELAGELKGYVDSKLLYLSRDANELNRQVFGLMVVGGFLPANEAELGSEVVNFGVNTVSQFLSNQLSLYVSELLADVLNENGVFTRAEFNVNYSVFNNASINNQINNSNRASELSLQVKNYLFKERLAIKIGTDIGIGDASAITGSSVSAINTFDVIVEWVITKDRRFKLLVYNRNENTIFGPSRKSGFGASYRYEFDTIDEFFKGFRKKTREAIDSNI